MTEDTQTTHTSAEPAKRSGPAWQSDPEKKAAAAKKAVATRAANKAKKQAQENRKAERKATRQAAATPVSRTIATPADATSDDFLTRMRGQFAVAIEDADAAIEELSQTLQSAEGAAQEAREEMATATAARDLIAAKLAALEKVSA